MRNAISVRHSARPLPVELKLLLAGGFVIAGWLLATVLGAPSASADQAPSEPDTATSQQQPSLLGTATGLVGAVTGKVGTTLSAVTTTVDKTLSTVTETADQATHPIVGIVDDTVETITPAKPATTAPARVEPVVKTASEPAVTKAAAPQPAPPAAKEPAVAPVRHHALVAATPKPEPAHRQAVADPVHAGSVPPAPAPTDPGDPGVVITVSHDSGNGGRDLLAVLGPRASTESVQPIVGALTSGFLGAGTEAGLPPTSPD